MCSSRSRVFRTENKFVVGIVGQDDAKRLIGRVVDDIAARLRFLRCLNNEGSGGCRPGCEPLAGLLLSVFFLQLVEFDLRLMVFRRRLVFLAGFRIKPAKRFQGFVHCG
jgi:hypothetical protein